MLRPADTLADEVNDWLERFERAIAQGDPGALGALFQAESHWRDLVALTWGIRTVSGAEAIARSLMPCAWRVRAKGFSLAPRRTPPREVTRAGTTAVEAIFAFDTAEGRGSGVLRLAPAVDGGGPLKAWTLLTALDELGTGATMARDSSRYPRDFRGPNWLDQRRAEVQYADRDPAVLVVGGGQAGLSIAARLKALSIDALIVDREQRIGDNWRKRYHALTLHNQTHVNHLPYMPFPPTWPAYIPKDKLAAWFEAYVESLELNFWPATELEGGVYDEARSAWEAVLRVADGSTRKMRPRHIVLATGVSGIANIPDIPGLQRFGGTVLHSSAYEDGDAWAGKRALVIGTGNSGHDIAQDLHASGAQVCLVQRSPTMVVDLEPSAQLPYALYDEGLPLEDADLIAASIPFDVARKGHALITERARELDRDLLEGLERVGFRLDFGEDGTGWQFKYLTRGGGYYFNVGCSDLVAAGEIGLVQLADIEGFVAAGAQLRTGDTLAADLVVLATGYKGQEHLVARLFGSEIADRVGPIWGFGAGNELRNMFTRTPQSGLWFIAGSLAQCRIYSHYLALQVQAAERSALA